ncbi:MAG: EAL domain-containing protein [Pseudomonadota bacterium]
MLYTGMSNPGTSADQVKAADIDVYTTFVDSLFSARSQLLLGAVLQLAVTTLLWWTTAEPLLLALALVITLVACFRYVEACRYREARAARTRTYDACDMQWSRQWELKCAVSAGAASLLVGLVVSVGLHASDNQLVSISAFALLFAGFPTIVGRLYGSKMIATVMITALLLPPSAGLYFKQDTAHIMLAVLALPFAMLVLSNVKAVRIPVERAVRRRHEVEQLATNFDAALGAMPGGLIMLDDADRIRVVNQNATSMLDLASPADLEGRRISAIVRKLTKESNFAAGTARKYAEVLTDIVEGHRIRGTVTLNDGRKLQFTRNDTTDAPLVLLVEDVTQRVQSLTQMKKLARFDPLTDLPNRGYLETLISLRQKKSINLQALLLVFDIDDFKHINDTLGHHKGDALLKAIAARLSKFCPSDWDYGRQGGDEFLIFATGNYTQSELEQKLTAFCERMSLPYQFGDEQLRVTVSIGAYSCPLKAFDLVDGMRRADIALYRSKHLGKGRYTSFTDEMEARYRERQAMKVALLKAIEDDQLSVLYQPIISATNQRLHSVEALCRWTGSDGKPISPAVFIPLAEEMGVVSRITEHIHNKTCAELATWPDHLKASINLSADDFATLDLCAVVSAAIARYGISPETLTFELTETAVVKDRVALEKQLFELRELGVGVSLDDFGTGQSSLSYLASLPFDIIKVDRSFVTGIEVDPRQLELLTHTVRLCQTLGKKVVVEGVETIEQLEIVRQHVKADLVQGWVFAPALPASAIARLADIHITKKNLPLRGQG